jgi:hypothetical protein
VPAAAQGSTQLLAAERSCLGQVQVGPAKSLRNNRSGAKSWIGQHAQMV